MTPTSDNDRDPLHGGQQRDDEEILDAAIAFGIAALGALAILIGAFL